MLLWWWLLPFILFPLRNHPLNMIGWYYSATKKNNFGFVITLILLSSMELDPYSYSYSSSLTSSVFSIRMLVVSLSTNLENLGHLPLRVPLPKTNHHRNRLVEQHRRFFVVAVAVAVAVVDTDACVCSSITFALIVVV